MLWVIFGFGFFAYRHGDRTSCEAMYRLTAVIFSAQHLLIAAHGPRVFY